MEAGAAGVMIAPPPPLRTDDADHRISARRSEAIGADIPWVLQDYPLTLTVVMTPAVIRRIVTNCPSCVMLKHEDWPGLEKISALRAFQADGSMRPISILCGNGGMFLDFEMERGADGAMTGYAFPDMLVDVVRLPKAGERDAAHDLFDAHLPLIRYEQQPGVGLAVRKYVLMRRGIIASDAAQAGRDPHRQGEGGGRLSAVAASPASTSAPTCSRKRARRSSQFLMVRSAPSRTSRTMRAHLSHPSRRGPGAAPQDEVDTGVRPDVHRTRQTAARRIDHSAVARQRR